MNSGMETVSISTKSAFPNSRLSCSAMVPAHGLRWARTDSGGRARTARGAGPRGVRRARAGPGRGAGKGAPWPLGGIWTGRRPPRGSSARSGPARHTRQFPLLPRRRPGAVGGRDNETETAAAGPASGLGLAPAPRPARPAPPRPVPASRPPRLPAPPAEEPPLPGRRPPPPHLGGAHARGSRRGRAPGPGPGGWAAAPSGDGRWALSGAVLRSADVGGGWNQVSRIAASRPGLDSVQSLSRVRLSATQRTAASQASLPITNSRSLRKLTSIESAMPSIHLILYRPLLLPPSIFPRGLVDANKVNKSSSWSFSRG